MDIIPYVAQERPDGCAAAALCMVYRSLGVACEQAAMWPRLRGRRGRGHTHRIAQDAIGRGLAAAVVRPLDPWATLTGCVAASARVIVHHRLSQDEPAGHYSVVASLSDDGVSLHDPLRGEDRRLTREELMALWSPGGREGVGYVLVAIAPPGGEATCRYCEAATPESLSCPACRASIPLRPAAALGCLVRDCPGRRWESFYCPSCDMSSWWLMAGR